MSELDAAREIARHGENIAYPSRTAARRVRDVLFALLRQMEWRTAETAPLDGTHIIVCRGPFSEHWGFNQSPPCVVHFFPDADEPGFYLSHGIVAGSYNDQPILFTHWRPLGEPPRGNPA